MQISESQVGRAVRTHRWKYGVVAPDKDGWNESGADEYAEAYLYDLEADPYELRNLVSLEAYDKIRNELRERLLT